MNRLLEKYKKMATTIAIDADTNPTTVVKVLAAMEHQMSQARRCKNPPPPPGAISIGAASRKYNMHVSTIVRWVQKGLVPVILRTKRYKYIDELILAEIIRRYKADPGQGKRTLEK